MRSASTRSGRGGAGPSARSITTGVRDTNVLDRVVHLFGRIQTRALKQLPGNPGPDLSLEEFGEALFTRGLSNDSVDKLLSAFRRQRRLTK